MILETALREVRRRTRVAGRFPNELSALTLVFATLDLTSKAWATEEEDRMNWRGVRMDDELREAVAKAKQTVKEKNDFNIEAVEKYLKAA